MKNVSDIVAILLDEKLLKQKKDKTYVFHTDYQWKKADIDMWTRFHRLFPYKFLRSCMDLVNKALNRREKKGQHLKESL